MTINTVKYDLNNLNYLKINFYVFLILFVCLSSGHKNERLKMNILQKASKNDDESLVIKIESIDLILNSLKIF